MVFFLFLLVLFFFFFLRYHLTHSLTPSLFLGDKTKLLKKISFFLHMSIFFCNFAAVLHLISIKTLTK